MSIFSWLEKILVSLHFRSRASIEREDRSLRVRYVICVRGLRLIKSDLNSQLNQVDDLYTETADWRKFHRVQNKIESLKWRGNVLGSERNYCLKRRAELRAVLERRRIAV